MNVGKSITIALFDKGMKKRELAVALGVTPHTVTNLCASKTCAGDRLAKLCEIFEMDASEFIALGE